MRTRDSDKEQLVKQKAIESIVKNGFEGFSMNKLARACKISVATLYIYYKDRDDLITKIAIEEGKKMGEVMLKDFDPNASFVDGLRKQWQNRYHYTKEHPYIYLFFDQLRSSTYQSAFLDSFMDDFKLTIGTFMENVYRRGEIDQMPMEVFWSVAYGPLYSMIRFDQEGQNFAGKAFKMTDQVMWAAFDLVIKALKK